MDVLISWSKPRSRRIATLLHEFLPKVVPNLDPWMSDKDIDKGTEWFGELQSFLDDAKLCIVCVTAENAFALAPHEAARYPSRVRRCGSARTLLR